jgi:hypothetical protein
MDILRFTFQAVGFFTFVTAFIILVSHTVPGLDFLHAYSALAAEPLAVGFLAHLVAAIMLAGVGYLLFAIGKGR